MAKLSQARCQLCACIHLYVGAETNVAAALSKLIYLIHRKCYPQCIMYVSNLTSHCSQQQNKNVVELSGTAFRVANWMRCRNGVQSGINPCIWPNFLKPVHLRVGAETKVVAAFS